jgi:hypothetical protein
MRNDCVDEYPMEPMRNDCVDEYPMEPMRNDCVDEYPMEPMRNDCVDEYPTIKGYWFSASPFRSLIPLIIPLCNAGGILSKV